MTTKEIPVCEICEKPKTLLKERLGITNEEIFVCTTPVKKSSMPCDGWIVKTAVLA